MAQTHIGDVEQPVVQERAMDPVYRHSIVESKYVPHTSFLSFVSGQPGLAEYYRGSYGQDEMQQAFEPDSIETYSSYKRISNLIIKFDTISGYNFDPAKAQSTDVISGYVLFDLTPNENDLFIRDIGDGRAGLYQIFEQPEIKTVAADKCYYITARLQAVVTETIMENLNRKVIEELYYQKDIAVAGGNAILTKFDVDLNRKIYEGRQAIIDDILTNFYFWDENTVTVPNELKDHLYDPYLAKFLSYTIPAELLGPRAKIQLLDVNYYVQDKGIQEPITIWDMFYKGMWDHPERFKRKYYTHHRDAMLNTRMYGNVFFSKIDRVINIHLDSARMEAYKYTGSVFQIGPGIDPPTPGTEYTYYFSEEFYNGGGTPLEKFIWEMWRDKTVDKARMVEVLDGYWSLEPKDKLYMGGIYIGACKQALRTSSSFT